jgi:hypothetical protein
MSKIALSGNASGTGTFTIASPDSNSDRTLNLPDAAGTIQVSGNPISGTTGTFTGLVDISAAGAGQIQFPATQNASANANTLDDYEEGTWTPGLGGTWSSNPTSLSGQYVKIGATVWLRISWIDGTKASATSAHFTGVPFSVSNQATAAVSNVAVIDYGNALVDGNQRVFLTANSFANTCFATFVYQSS